RSCLSPPELYKSIIEDVIEGVRELFAEEGVEEQVLKDLKQLWETKVTQSKATEGFFKHSHCSPRFSLQLPHRSRSILQTSAASFVIQTGRGFQQFTAAKLVCSCSDVSGLDEAVVSPAEAVLTLLSVGQLYKVNMPVVVTQASGDGNILHYPVQQMFHPLGQASVLQTSLASAAQVNASAAHAAGETLQPQETAVQQAVLFKPSYVEKQHLESSATLVQQPTVNLQEFEINAELNQCSESTEKFQHDNLHTAVFTPECSEGLFVDESLASSSSSVLLDVEGQLDVEHPELLQQQDLKLHITFVLNFHCGDDSQAVPGLFHSCPMEPMEQTESDLPLEKDLCSDIEGISQLDGTGDVSSNEQIPHTKDKEENELVGFIDSEDLRVLDDEEDYDEDCDSSSNIESSCSDGDNEDLQIDIVEEDPLNSGDDVSEQDIADLFDTDNVIVCQYEKIHRTKNKWKFYLKDGVMSIEGKDHVFAKATGDAEW
uniref:General transcription factor IIA subunit 1 like n=1 Tax=Catharus ustulatus TaxID=91951 RepID=A0A8C3U058_CATUS